MNLIENTYRSSHVDELNNNPPTGDLRGGYLDQPRVDPDIDKEERMPLALLVMIPPLEKVPVSQGEAQFLAAAQIEFGKDVLQVGLHSFGRNDQGARDLIVSVAKADQCNYLLLPMGKG